MRIRLTIPHFVAIFLLATSTLWAQGTSSWVFFGPDGRLQYTTDAQGNRIMDYSYAGYQGGGISLPAVPVQQTLSPSGVDDATAIQAAIDVVSGLDMDANGFRGAVLLTPGTFNLSATLNINASGVVLRGSGSGSDGTILNMTGDPFLLLKIAGAGSYQTAGNPSASITDSYVPSGSMTLNVDDASAFAIGDPVLIVRPVTQAWVSFMGMDKLVRNGQPQTWLAAGSTITTDRTVAAIDGNQITLDVPLTDSLDSTYLNPPGGSVVKYTFPGRISQVGVEHLSVIAPPLDVDISQPQYQAISISAALNAWVLDVPIQDTQNSISVSNSAKQVTLDSVVVAHTMVHSFSDAPADFSLSGTQVLANNCSVTGVGNTWPAVTSSRVTGPVVLLNFFADDRGFDPHQRWATGLLCDGCNFPNSHTGDKAGIAYSNRGIFGSGHGWDSGWALVWNVNSTYFLVQEPPGAHNWCIGCVGNVLTEAMPGGDGTLLPNGIYDSLGTPVTPTSLYLEQLCERLGPGALTNIGSSGSCVGPADFALSATPDSQSVIVGGRTSYAATLTPSAGFADTVNLSVSALPVGVKAAFHPASISGGSGCSVLRVSTDGSAVAGTYLLTITGATGKVSHTTKVTLTINPVPIGDFTVAVKPTSQTVTAGSTTTYTVTVFPMNGFSDTVGLSATALPTGATAAFDPPSILGGSGSSMVSVATSNSTAAVTYTFTIIGASTGMSHSATLTLVVTQSSGQQRFLNADGQTDTYTLINNVLGGTAEEVPDCSHPDFGPHITQAWDSDLGKYVFVFHIHVTPDNDRCAAFDRQRNEIKTYGPSPDYLKGFLGDTVTFRWRFRLDPGFQPSPSFTHIHQIKAGDGDSGAPIVTLTPRSGNPDILQITHTDSNSVSTTLLHTDLAPFKGAWVEAYEQLTYGSTGTYSIQIVNVSDGSVLLSYSNDNIDLWRTGTTFVRPKWGIYRSLNNANFLRDEQVRFGGFCLAKGSDDCASTQ
jgi:hypothetical protein